MIARVDGTLERLEADHAQVTLPGGVTLEVLLPAFTVARLHGSEGEAVTLHTILFIESQAQGAMMMPRLAGFLSEQDRTFYQLFVTCKGIGYRRALRAMTLSSGRIATAIAERDIATLQSLPEVGKRTAETIAATLHDKVDGFADMDGEPTTVQPTDKAGRAATATSGGGGRGQLRRAVLDVLVQLGENRADAMSWIDRALSQDEPPTDEESLIAEVYRIKAGA
ncbi:MAG: Holliday junction branch migration protein RuvA [Phycisphaeraceae bacterium]